MKDTDTQTNNTVYDLANIMDKPSLVALAYSLRHPETWPEGFQWDYSTCQTCAMGLAAKLWSMHEPDSTAGWLSQVARTFAVPMEDVVRIFQDAKMPFDWRHPFAERNTLQCVTPERIADLIDCFLSKQR